MKDLIEKSDIKHTTIRNNNLFCLNCGGEHRIIYPIGIDEMGIKVRQFNDLHGDCKKTWTEPGADMSSGVKERAMWWIANGETGSSSKTMWNCFMGNKNFSFAHPYDPDDFKRCYKLLKAIPEWKSNLVKLKNLSPAWNNLVDNWDKLTEMYERNVREDWKNHKAIGMYDFMQKLIK